MWARRRERERERENCYQPKPRFEHYFCYRYLSLSLSPSLVEQFEIIFVFETLFLLLALFFREFGFLVSHSSHVLCVVFCFLIFANVLVGCSETAGTPSERYYFVRFSLCLSRLFAVCPATNTFGHKHKQANTLRILSCLFSFGRFILHSLSSMTPFCSILRCEFHSFIHSFILTILLTLSLPLSFGN